MVTKEDVFNFIENKKFINIAEKLDTYKEFRKEYEEEASKLLPLLEELGVRGSELLMLGHQREKREEIRNAMLNGVWTPLPDTAMKEEKEEQERRKKPRVK